MVYEMDIFTRNFAGFLREMRKRRSLTQQELSRVSDLDYKHIQKLEDANNPKDPRLSTLRKLSRALRVPTKDVVAAAFGEN
ncbi:MAG: helix-turn-helix transcriptional regulator [Spirochaetia bacterium]|nr:helix-turn-helix transcriptional regulator [Spirochaetia bacterium]